MDNTDLADSAYKALRDHLPIAGLSRSDETAILTLVSQRLQTEVAKRTTSVQDFTGANALGEAMKHRTSGGLFLRAAEAGSWEGTFANTVRSMLDDVLNNGPCGEVRVIVNRYTGEVGYRVFVGMLIERNAAEDSLVFADGTEVPLEDIFVVEVAP